MKDIISFIEDKRFIGDTTLSDYQKVLLKSIYGLPLDRQEKRIFRECTRLKRYKPKVYRESTIICGRRGGKSNQIAVYPCSEVAARGTSTVCAVLDELAFFKHEGVSVDREIVNSIKPSLIQFFESKILKVSNPGKKSGIVYQDYKEHFAKDSEVLVFQAPSHKMNPQISKQFVDGELTKDRAFAASEYMAQFKDDIANVCAGSCVLAARVDSYRLPPPSYGISETVETEAEKMDREAKVWLLGIKKKMPKNDHPDNLDMDALEAEMMDGLEKEIAAEIRKESSKDVQFRRGWED